MTTGGGDGMTKKNAKIHPLTHLVIFFFPVQTTGSIKTEFTKEILIFRYYVYKKKSNLQSFFCKSK